MRPHVLHISTPLSWRGGEQQMIYLVEELHKKGIKQHVICPEGSKVSTYLFKTQIPFSTVKRGFKTLPVFSKEVKKICLEKGITIIHTHDSKAHTKAIFAAAILGNSVPIIVSRRVDFPIKKSPLSLWKYNHPLVKKILCVSDTIKNITGKSIKNKGVLETVYSGIDLSKFKESFPVKGKLRKEFQINADTVLIGNVAAIAPHKDYYTFVDTVEVLVNKNLKAHYFIIGDGPMYKEIESYIKEKSLEKHISMTGFRSDIPEILPELDVFLFTSETEGLGTSLLDAFACKVPIVATPAGGAIELIKQNQTGILGEIKNPKILAESVQVLLENPELRNTVIEGGLKHLQQFKKENTALKTLTIYESVL